MENTKQTANILWVDIAKFIGITLVIFHHTSSFISEQHSVLFLLQEYINLFHMPLFFVLAGYLYKDKGLKQNIRKIWWSLLIPYLIYQSIYFPFRLTQEVVFNHEQIFVTIKKLFIGYILGDNIDTSLFESVCAPLWFLIVIMQLRFIFAFVKETKINLCLISFLAIVILKILITNKTDLYFCLDNTLFAIPFFVFGILCKQYKATIIQNFKVLYKNNLIKYSLIFICFFSLIPIFAFNNYLNIARLTHSFAENQFLSLIYLAGIIGTLGTCLFASCIKIDNDFTKTISKNTLFIIYFHWQMLLFVRLLNIKQCIVNLNEIPVLFSTIEILICILLTFSNIMINYYIIKFLEKRVPLILGKGLKNANN